MAKLRGTTTVQAGPCSCSWVSSANLELYHARTGPEPLHGVFLDVDQVTVTPEISCAAARAVGVGAQIEHLNDDFPPTLPEPQVFSTEPAPMVLVDRRDVPARHPVFGFLALHAIELSGPLAAIVLGAFRAARIRMAFVIGQRRALPLTFALHVGKRGGRRKHERQEQGPLKHLQHRYTDLLNPGNMLVSL